LSFLFVYYAKYVGTWAILQLRFFKLFNPRVDVLDLSGGTADEEPLVDRAVNLLSGKLLVSRQRRKVVGLNAARRVGDGGVGAKHC
jgi:hypothetical protein